MDRLADLAFPAAAAALAYAAQSGAVGPATAAAGAAVLTVAEAARRMAKSPEDGLGEAAIEAEYDYNGEAQLGAGHCQVTMRRGQRCSAAAAYLHPLLRDGSRPNLHVRARAPVDRVLFDADGGAVGVAYRRGGEARHVAAAREVILCAGAVYSPAILMRSGVGPRAELARLGVDEVADLPVGEGLRDHCMVPMGHTTSVRTLGPRDENLATAARYFWSRTGPAASNGLELTSFVRTGVREDLPEGMPDLQVHVTMTMGSSDDFVNFNQDPRWAEDVSKLNGLTSLPVLLHPRSVGRVTLRSADPDDAPLIDPRYLEHPDDVRVLVAGLRLAERVMEQPAWREAGVEVERFADTKIERACPHEPGTDAFYEYMAREMTLTVYHPVGTCQIGAVVDPQLRVLGVPRLRVADASVMPRIVSGNTNAAAIMVGERAADLVRGRKLPPVAGTEP